MLTDMVTTGQPVSRVYFLYLGNDRPGYQSVAGGIYGAKAMDGLPEMLLRAVTLLGRCRWG